MYVVKLGHLSHAYPALVPFPHGILTAVDCRNPIATKGPNRYGYASSLAHKAQSLPVVVGLAGAIDDFAQVREREIAILLRREVSYVSRNYTCAMPHASPSGSVYLSLLGDVEDGDRKHETTERECALCARDEVHS